jgi:hypothetical protein
MMYTVFHLTPSKKTLADSPGYFEQRFELFSQSQREAIAAFFKDVVDYQLFDSDGGELERAKSLWPNAV